MTSPLTLRLGTRKSALALAQSGHVARDLDLVKDFGRVFVQLALHGLLNIRDDGGDINQSDDGRGRDIAVFVEFAPPTGSENYAIGTRFAVRIGPGVCE